MADHVDLSFRVVGFPLLTVPQEIIHLENVTRLSLDGVGIAFLPESLPALSRLRRLSLRSNALRFLAPCPLLDLPLLVQLNVEDNPLFSPPEGVISRGWGLEQRARTADEGFSLKSKRNQTSKLPWPMTDSECTESLERRPYTADPLMNKASSSKKAMFVNGKLSRNSHM